MQIKLLVSRATITGSQSRGEIIDVAKEEANRMIDAGQAELVRNAAPTENTSRARRKVKAEK